MPSYFAVPPEYGHFPKSELTGILQGVSVVLESWAHLPARYIGVPVEGPAPLALEFSVKFSGNASGFLNIRTTSEMAQILLKALEGQSPQQRSKEEVFKEFVDIFSGRLMAYLWGNDWGLFKSGVPVFTTPLDWPSIDPTACCVFLVENWPVEVRLWMENLKPGTRK